MDDRNGLRVGDIVTCYYKGYHRVIGFHMEHDVLQVAVEQVLSSKFTKCPATKRSCCIVYCAKVTHESIEEMQRAYNAGLDALDLLVESASRR